MAVGHFSTLHFPQASQGSCEHGVPACTFDKLSMERLGCCTLSSVNKKGSQLLKLHCGSLSRALTDSGTLKHCLTERKSE